MADNGVVTVTELARPEGLLPADRVREEAARLAVIVTQAEAEAAGTFLRLVKDRIRLIERHYKQLRDPFNEALRRVRVQEAEDVGPWQEAATTVGGSLLAWQVAQKREADQRARAAQAQAEETARQERQRQAEALRQAAAVSDTKKDAAALEAQAKRVENAPIQAVAAPVAAAPKIAGVSVSMSYRAVVTDLATLVRAVASGKAPLAALMADQSWLDKQAVANGLTLGYPGVMVEEKPIQTARSLR